MLNRISITLRMVLIVIEMVILFMTISFLALNIVGQVRGQGLEEKAAS